MISVFRQSCRVQRSRSRTGAVTEEQENDIRGEAQRSRQRSIVNNNQTPHRLTIYNGTCFLSVHKSRGPGAGSASFSVMHHMIRKSL